MAPIMPIMMTRPATVHSKKLRFLNRPSGISGSAARRSTATNSNADTMQLPISSKMTGESQSYTLPPHEMTKMRHVVAAAMVMMPGMSMRAAFCLSLGW